MVSTSRKDRDSRPSFQTTRTSPCVDGRGDDAVQGGPSGFQSLSRGRCVRSPPLSAQPPALSCPAHSSRRARSRSARLQKGIANDLFNAIRLCNPNGGDFGRLINWCRNDGFRNSPVPHHCTSSRLFGNLPKTQIALNSSMSAKACGC
jgi:hypothetical protein